MSWVNVEDNVPNRVGYGFVRCNVYTDKGKVSCAMFNTLTGNWMSFSFDYFERGYITHWQYLPEPPK